MANIITYMPFLEDLSGLEAVDLDLLNEVSLVGKLDLAADVLDKFHSDICIVEISIKVKKECLDGGTYIPKGGIVSDINDRIPCLIFIVHAHGINPICRQQGLIGLDIRCGIPLTSPPCHTVDDRAVNTVGMEHESGRARYVSRLYQLPDSCT